jgi:hypothetical protein
MSRPIYGISKRVSDACNCVPDIPLTTSLQSFKLFLSKLRDVIANFYNPTLGVADVRGNMTMTAAVSTVVYVRLVWVQMPNHTDVKFDKTNPIHLEDLKFIYNNIGKDWLQDPLASFMATA